MKMYIIPLFYLYVAICWYATCSNSVIITKWCLCPIFCEIALMQPDGSLTPKFRGWRLVPTDLRWSLVVDRIAEQRSNIVTGCSRHISRRLGLRIKSIKIACGISDVWAGSMYWLSSKWSEQIWYELYNCFAVFEPRSHGLVCMTHFLDLLKHNDVAAREEVV